MLSPQEYGEAALLITLLFIVSVPSVTLTTFIAKYTAENKGQGSQFSIKPIYDAVNKYSLLISLVTLPLLWIISPLLAEYFKVGNLVLVLFWILLPLSLVSGTPKGILQGTEDFIPFTLTNIINTFLKIIIAFILIKLNFSVEGVVAALILSTIFSYIYSYIKASGYINRNYREELVFHGLPTYLSTIFFATLFWGIFGNVDVILAKHYLTPFDAGQYSALAVMGRIVTYSAIAIVSVLFPMVAASQGSQADKGKKVLGLSLLVVFGISIIILLFYYFLPEFTVTLLFSAKYLPIAGYLGVFGLSMMLGALASVFIYYFMAIHAKKFIYPFGIVTLVQIISIMLWHQSIFVITLDLLFTSLLLLLTMAVTYVLERQKKPPTEAINPIIYE